MKRKKLLIVVGSGASLDFGLPSVKEVDQLFDACASETHPLADDPTSNLYRYCRDAIDRYYAKHPRPALRKYVNFEEVLYQLNTLAPYLSDPNRLVGSNALLSAKSIPDILRHGQTREAVNHNILADLASTLMTRLAWRFIDECSHVRANGAARIAELRSFLEAVQDKFEIGILTLNYDNLLSQALPNLHTGFDSNGDFDPMSVFERDQWGFIYHLHGSVHFAMAGTARDMHGVRWVDTPKKNRTVDARGRSAQDSVEGITYPTSPIVAGYGKTQQILRQPFRTYFAQANRLAHEADSLLFLGYGFNDMHLNALFSEVRDRRRPVVVVDWADDHCDPLPFRTDAWSYQLLRTLPPVGAKMSYPGGSAAADVAELKANREMEVSNNPTYPLAVWYNGMIEACRNPAKILKHL